MPSPFETALKVAGETLAKFAGQQITYRAGSISITIDDAILGSSEYESDEGTGVIVRANVTDWLISVAKLEHDGNAIEPAPGHRIEHTVGGQKRTYEINPLGSQPCYRFSGPYRDRYRIHCREIPNEN